jgi:hypothetical protein
VFHGMPLNNEIFDLFCWSTEIDQEKLYQNEKNVHKSMNTVCSGTNGNVLTKFQLEKMDSQHSYHFTLIKRR